MKKKNIIRLALVLVGVVLVVFGVIQGDAGDTLQKAVRICLECIGIG